MTGLRHARLWIVAVQRDACAVRPTRVNSSKWGFALLCDDPDAPGGTSHHWVAYDVPTDQSELAENASQGGTSQDFKQAVNNFQKLARTPA